MTSEVFFRLKPSALTDKVFALSVVILLVFTAAHMISLPVVITYDGLQYVDLADVLFSSRFPHDWLNIRTPLYPLTLKAAFGLLGMQPLAVIAVSTVAGAVGALILGLLVRRLLGDIAGAAVLILLTFYPTLTAFEHFALTEAGSYLFLAIIIALLVWVPTELKTFWYRASLLTIAISAAYYWRQNFLPLVVPCAFFHGWSAAGRLRARISLGRPAARTAIISTLLVQVALIAVGPYGISKFWDKYLARDYMADYLLKEGMLRQVLLLPTDPVVGEYREAYREAIRESIFDGNFYSGLREDLMKNLRDKIFAKPLSVSTPEFYWRLIKDDPSRYVSGVGRTFMQFVGLPSCYKETQRCRRLVLSDTMPGSKISGRPMEIAARLKSQFEQKTTTSAVQRILLGLAPAYDHLLIVSNLMTAAGLLAGLAWRHYRLTVLCGIPFAFTIPLAIILACNDRYVFPAYPVSLANVVLLPVMACGAIRRRGWAGKVRHALQKHVSTRAPE